MKLSLKSVIICSALLAGTCNACQYLATYQQRKDAFAPSWAYASSSATPAPVGAASLQPTPGAPTAKTTSTTADPAVAAAANLSRAGLKSDYASLYLAVEAKTGTPWEILAAVHKVETNQAGDTNRASSAGAVGPMQFMPATFRSYSLDGDGNGSATITDLDDAMYSAGRYLAANGAARGQYGTALYQYNHSWSYVSKVNAIAKRLGL